MHLVCRVSVVFHYEITSWYSMCPHGPTMLNKQTNKQTLPTWNCTDCRGVKCLFRRVINKLGRKSIRKFGISCREDGTSSSEVFLFVLLPSWEEGIHCCFDAVSCFQVIYTDLKIFSFSADFSFFYCSNLRTFFYFQPNLSYFTLISSRFFSFFEHFQCFWLKVIFRSDL